MDGMYVGNSFAQKIWQKLPSMFHPDLLSSKGSPQLPETLLSPWFPDSNPKNVLLSSPEPLLTLLSLNRNSPGSPAGAPQMCFMPILEDNGQDYEERHGCSIKDWPDCSRKNNALNQTWVGTVEEMEEGLMIQSLWHLSQHVSLANRAGRLQQRVLAVLGEHASRHYSQQLDGLKKKLLETCCSPSYSMMPDPFFENYNAAEVGQGLGRNPLFTKQPLESRELQNLAHGGHAVLQGLLESLDSDATASSSDDEWDHEDTKAAKSHCGVCEWRWLRDRAELCSRWTWMQMRLSELDSQIQRIGKLQQQILSNKGRVVLAESQPLTDRQIQHTLWTETMDLSFTAGNMRDLQSDLEMEPSSPTRLLRNIERQSAQLTQIVNSLMPSFCASPSSSPLSKGSCNHWRGQQKTTYSRLQCLPKAKKRKRTSTRRQYIPQMDVTFMSARTRPLLNYHKPRLFIMDPLSHREQVLEYSSSVFPKCASCDPASSGAACPCIKKKADGKVHPILSLSSETPLSFHLQNALFKESELQRSPHLKTELFSPHHSLQSKGRVSRSLFHCSHQPKNKVHLKRHRRESTPIRWAGTRDYHSQAFRESKRRRYYSERPMDMQISSFTLKSDLVSQSDGSHVEEPLDDVNLSYCTPSQRRSSQFSVRRRNWESIDNIAIPMSLFASVKVEKLQYKNILTPSWRKLNISHLLERENDEQEEELSEAIEDADFFQRHQIYERREKLHWSCWDQDSQSIRSSRRSCCSASLRDHPAHCHPPAHSPVPSTFSPPEDLEDDRELLPPWRRRMFPLADEDEETLRLPDNKI